MHSTEFKLEIKADKALGMSYGYLARKYNLSRSNIQRILKSFKNKKLKIGPKEIITKNDKRKIQTLIDINNAEGKKSTSLNMKHNLNLNASKNTICRALRCMQYNTKIYHHNFHYHGRTKKND